MPMPTPMSEDHIMGTPLTAEEVERAVVRRTSGWHPLTRAEFLDAGGVVVIHPYTEEGIVLRVGAPDAPPNLSSWRVEWTPRLEVHVREFPVVADPSLRYDEARLRREETL